MNKLCRPVNRTIEQDWDKIRKIYNRVVAKMKNNELDADSQWVEEWGSTQYNLGKLGSLIMGDTLTPQWGAASGPIFESALPWASQARELFKSLNFHSMIWSDTIANVARHRDGQPDHEVGMPECKINFIVSSDDINAKTIVYDNLYSEQYPSTLNSVWLLDTSYPHEIWSNGHREVFQFKFFNHYADVANFLETIGSITFK